MARESLWSKVPDYRIDLDPSDETRRVHYRGEVIAESACALVVRETEHDPIVYFPREDVRIQHMERTEQRTFCPFKGEACYWTLRVGDHTSENTAWSYETPFPEVAGLRDYVAFYPDRVEWD
ncbi:MAG: DUF427 domain-containing protein [bacterium]|nr:DUF427 domain-containing protein [bacterium]MCP5068826.1 DUF427 domain-containing protein [bacterium]